MGRICGWTGTARASGCSASSFAATGKLRLGSPDFVTLSEAREAALENRKLARTGGDPLQARREAAAILTFEEAARKVH